MYKTTAYISLDNIEHNVRLMRKKLKAETRLMVAIKADAYGHGMVEVAKRLYSIGVGDFAVATLDEALLLREILPESNILILGFTPPQAAKDLSKNDIVQTVYGLDFAKALSENCKKDNVSVRCHIAFDTGMGRIGFTDSQSAFSAANLLGIEVEGAFTHLSCADMLDTKSEEFTRNQYKRFLLLCGELEELGVSLKIKHCSNSAAIFKYPEFQLDMVRAGIATYGLSPNPDDKETYTGLKPAMELRATISHIKEVQKGATISYGATFVAPKNMRVATVACGYGDGYHRSNSAGYVLVCGKRAKILGRVCMDQFMVDVTDIPDAQFLSSATLFGHSGDEFLPIEELANLSDTINYQIACDVSKRVERIYE